MKTMEYKKVLRRGFWVEWGSARKKSETSWIGMTQESKDTTNQLRVSFNWITAIDEI